MFNTQISPAVAEHTQIKLKNHLNHKTIKFEHYNIEPYEKVFNKTFIQNQYHFPNIKKKRRKSLYENISKKRSIENMRHDVGKKK